MSTREAITLADRPSAERAFAATAYDAERPAPPKSASQDDALIGRKVDHFEIQALLGEGGMGRVYLAKDLSLDRPVALKILRRELAEDPALIGRLVTEARAQARLQHPNVVTIYYIGVFEGDSYFVMEYIQGKTLAELLREDGPLPWAQALDVILDTARALAAANARGMVHRDIKPSNLILGERPTGVRRAHVKVADFGLATDSPQVETRFMGTPHYASPEQMDGKAPDFRSDMYSLAVTFFELLTGDVPFHAEELEAITRLHRMADRPPIPDRVAPWRLRQLITQMMDPDPNLRPQSYEALIARLELLRQKPTVAGGLIARGAATVVDFMLAAMAGQLMSNALGWSQRGAFFLWIFFYFAYYVTSHRLTSTTIGKRVLGLHLVGTTRRITVPRLLLRFAIQFWAPLIAGIGFLVAGGSGDLASSPERLPDLAGLGTLSTWPNNPNLPSHTLGLVGALLALPWLAGLLLALFDRDRQTLHDRASCTRVLVEFPVENGTVKRQPVPGKSGIERSTNLIR